MLGNEKRIAIIKALAEKPLFVREIQRKTKMKQAECSSSLLLLKAAGLVKSTRTGTSISYELADYKLIDLVDYAEKI